MPGSHRSSDPCRTASRRPAQTIERDPVRQPRCETDDGLDRGGVGDLHRDRSAHRESEQERPLGADRVDRRTGIFDAPVQALPRLDPIADLGERELAELWGEVRGEPFERRTPRAGDLVVLASVHADDRRGRVVAAR